jgi:multicomponent Na+:H+ antiporter subunit E
VVIGILVTIVLSLFTYGSIGVSFKTERKVWAKIGYILAYLARLVFEVIIAAIQMVKLILSPEIRIKPRIFYFNSPVRSEAAKVALANSIILTPGSITFELEGNRFGVHAIDVSVAEEISDSSYVFVNRLKKIEGGH